MDKYYIPNSSELHVGFEVEMYSMRSGWEPRVLDHRDLEIAIATACGDFTADEYDEIYRVKYLDQFDIESLGFKYEKHRGGYTLYVNYSNGNKGILVLTYSGSIQNGIILYDYINVTAKTSNKYPLFQGHIKNKSELKRLLKQLGIKEDE